MSTTKNTDPKKATSKGGEITLDWLTNTQVGRIVGLAAIANAKGQDR